MGLQTPKRNDKVIRISEETAKMINQIKVHKRVSYNEVINFLAKTHIQILEGNK